jgi:hypothetical protein
LQAFGRPSGVFQNQKVWKRRIRSASPQAPVGGTVLRHGTPPYGVDT